MSVCKITIKDGLLKSSLGKETFDTLEDFQQGLLKAIEDRKAIPVRMTVGKGKSKKTKFMFLDRRTGDNGNFIQVQVQAPGPESGETIAQMFNQTVPFKQFSVQIPDLVEGNTSTPDIDTLTVFWLSNYFSPVSKQEFSKALKELEDILTKYSQKDSFKSESPAFFNSLVSEDGIYGFYKSVTGPSLIIEGLIPQIKERFNKEHPKYGTVQTEPVFGKFENYQTLKDREKLAKEFESVQAENEPSNKAIWKNFSEILENPSEVELGRDTLIHASDLLFKAGFQVRIRPTKGSELYVQGTQKNGEPLTLEMVKTWKDKQTFVGIVEVYHKDEWIPVYLNHKPTLDSLNKSDYKELVTLDKANSYNFEYKVGEENLSSNQLYLMIPDNQRELVTKSMEEGKEIFFKVAGDGSGNVNRYRTIKERGFTLSDIKISKEIDDPEKGVPKLEGMYLKIGTLENNPELLKEVIDLLKGKYSERDANRVVSYLDSLIGLGTFSKEGKSLDAKSDLTNNIFFGNKPVSFNVAQVGENWIVEVTVNRVKTPTGFKDVQKQTYRLSERLSNEAYQGILAARININLNDEGEITGYDRLKVTQEGLKSIDWKYSEQMDFIADNLKTHLIKTPKGVVTQKYIFTQPVINNPVTTIDNIPVAPPIVDVPLVTGESLGVQKDTLKPKEKKNLKKVFQTKQGETPSKESLESGIKWLKQVMPEAPIEIVEELIDGIGRGSFESLKDLITLSKKYADGTTVRHEVFHRAFSMISKEQREKLLDEGSKKFGIERESQDFESSDDLAIEEKMAEWAEEHLGKGYVAQNWFEEILQKIWNWIQSLIKDQGELENLVRDINQGKFRKGKVNLTQSGLSTSFQKSSTRADLIVGELEIRELAARLAARIGSTGTFSSDITKDYAGWSSGNQWEINLAKATLDTPLHEIIFHPVVRAIKNNPTQKELYNSLLKELETGYGKEVLDRVKKEYIVKPVSYNYTVKNEYWGNANIEELNVERTKKGLSPINLSYLTIKFQSEEEAKQYVNRNSPSDRFNIKIVKNTLDAGFYTLEEQQEEALVELLGQLTAGKIKETKENKNLISLLKHLLKEMTAYMRSLFNSKEIEIDKLSADMTLNDLANLLAYTNSKIILPGNSVEYTTPDNRKFFTYQEASNHISKLFGESKDVDLSDVNINDKVKVIKYNNKEVKDYSSLVGTESYEPYLRINIIYEDGTKESIYENDADMFLIEINQQFASFILKNKQFERSKEIIETWKKENNIVYNPEEVYSRGQGFYSAIGAYSSLELDLLLQNLLQHIEDNKKAGGEFNISAFTAPVGKTLKHLGGESQVRFVIFPQPNDIKWAAPTDVHSGSVWDAAEKVSKDKKSELVGVSHTKYPLLQKVNEVSPNLADIIDYRSHHHNELGIELTLTNFELEFDSTVPYEIKKLVENVNKILQQKRLQEVENLINSLPKEC